MIRCRSGVQIQLPPHRLLRIKTDTVRSFGRGSSKATDADDSPLRPAGRRFMPEFIRRIGALHQFAFHCMVPKAGLEPA